MDRKEVHSGDMSGTIFTQRTTPQGDTEGGGLSAQKDSINPSSDELQAAADTFVESSDAVASQDLIDKSSESYGKSEGSMDNEDAFECGLHPVQSRQFRSPKRKSSRLPTKLSYEPSGPISADTLKSRGNAEFKNGNLSAADEWYTRAIEIGGDPLGVCYNNRATTRYMMGLFGLAIDDASNALKLNPSFCKAYFRRAESLVALGRFEDAERDFVKASELCPDKTSIKVRLKAVQRKILEIRASREAQMVDIQKPIHLLNSRTMRPPVVYKGPNIAEDEKITEEKFYAVLKYCRTGKILSAPAFANLLHLAYKLLSQEPTLIKFDLETNSKIISKTRKEDSTTVPSLNDKETTSVPDRPRPVLNICGDIHGQVYDLAYFLDQVGLPRNGEKYVFLGDYVDRRDHGISVLQILLTLKLVAPDRVVLLRGNHECAEMNRQFGFGRELTAAYRPAFFGAVQDVFDVLPLAALINSSIFCVHGGIPVNSGAMPSEIAALERDMLNNPIVQEMLWSDPQDICGLVPSPRGCGYMYGPDQAMEWMKKAGVCVVFRAHQMNYEGIREDFCSTNGPLEPGRWHYTVFSAPNYCFESNRGRVLQMTSEQISLAASGSMFTYSTVNLDENPVRDPKVCGCNGNGGAGSGGYHGCGRGRTGNYSSVDFLKRNFFPCQAASEIHSEGDRAMCFTCCRSTHYSDNSQIYFDLNKYQYRRNF